MSDFLLRILSGGDDDSPRFSGVSHTIFFIFIWLIIGAVIRRWIPLPYTPILLSLGLLVGLFKGSLDILGDSGEIVTSLDHEGIMLVFIPILIFESAFNANWHIFKRCIFQILLLIGPGVVFSFGLIAVSLKVILRYNDEELSWSAALMFGAIASSTDPLSISALLKEIGAPHYLTAIIEGESHLSDGVSFIFFVIFSGLTMGNHVSAGHSIVAFFLLAFGGLAIGLVFSFLTELWEEKIQRDAILSITIVFSACYMLFWVAESFKASFAGDFNVGASGVIGVCVLGLYMAAAGKTMIPTVAEEPLHVVVSWAQYVAETLIFILTGIVVGQILTEEDSTIEGSDWGRMIALYFLIYIIRIIVLLILYPVFNKVGYKLNIKELFVLSYSGLRGSLGLVLAMSVDTNEEKYPQRTRELILFFAAGTALLSILINGMTLGPIVKKIKLTKKFPAHKEIFKAFVKNMDQVGLGAYEKIREENLGKICDWEIVKKFADTTEEISKDKLLHNGSHGPQSFPSKRVTVSDEDLKTETRFRLLHIFKQLIWESYDEAQLGSHAANVLETAVNESLDDPSRPIQMFVFLRHYFMHPKVLKVLIWCSKITYIGSYFKQILSSHMVLIYDICTVAASISEELKHFVEDIPVDKRITHQILDEFTVLRNTAQAYQNNLDNQFAGLIKYIATKRYATKILITKRKYAEERHKKGEIEEKEYEKLVHIIDKKIKNMHHLIKLKWEPPNFYALFTGFPIFSTIVPNQLEGIVKTSKIIKFKKGQCLLEEGKSFDGVYLITGGEIDVYANNKETKRGMGWVAAFINLVSVDNISKITVTAIKDGEAQKIRVEDLRKVMEINPKFEELVYKSAFKYLRFMKPDKAEPLLQLSELSCKSLMKQTQVKHFFKDRVVDLLNGGFIIHGQVKRNNDVFDDYSFVPKDTTPVVALSDGILMRFLCGNLRRRESSVTILG